MDQKKLIVIAGLIAVALVMTSVVPASARDANTSTLLLGGNLAGEEITVMLPGDVPLVMVRIPAGTFLMGSPEGERGNVFDNETQHQVTLTQDYYLGKTEITQGQWEAVTGTAMPMTCGDFGVGDDYPAYCVTWEEFAGPGGFIETLNQQQETTAFRMPTEAEWERAARADTTTRFSHGDVLECDDECGACAVHDEFMWWCGNSPDTSRPVGQKQPNPFGLHDMHGNLWEWVQDRYEADFSTEPVTDPTGPETGNDRVIRGGDWGGGAGFSRSASRVGGSPVIAEGGGAGFRLAATASALVTLDQLFFVAAAAAAEGAEGSFFQTDLDLNNTASDMAVEYELWWLPRGENNSNPMRSETFNLAGGQSVRIENVLSEAFGLIPNAVGAVVIAASNPYLIGMSRTYNIPPVKVSGTFGQAIPAVGEGELIETGQIRRTIFMSETSDFRANLGCVNGRDSAVEIMISLYSADGTALETKTMNLGPYSNDQINQIFRDYAPLNGYVDVRSNTMDASYYCYGSVLDNVTSDPTTILPQISSSGQRYYISAAALAEGAEGAFFQTDVDVSNMGGNSSFVFMWLPRGQDNSSPVQSDTLSLGGGMSERYENILDEVFGIEPSVVGAVGIDTPSELFISMSRTYNVPEGETSGTFGQALPGIQENDMIGPNDRRRIIFLSENSDLRANVGCASGSGVTTEIKVELYDSDGELLEIKTMTLAPWSNDQLNQLFRDYAPVNGYVDVWSETSGSMFYCYGSVLDNETSDPTTILPQ